MTRAQLQAAVFEALDNADLNGGCPCKVSVSVLVTDLLTCCSTVEGISERRVRPAVVAWLTARCAFPGPDKGEDQRTIDLRYQGAEI